VMVYGVGRRPVHDLLGSPHDDAAQVGVPGIVVEHRSYEQAVNSPKRELRVFTPEEGATEHIGLDHLPHVSTFIADWVDDTFTELSRAGS
jgi:hypothetical protein